MSDGSERSWRGFAGLLGTYTAAWTGTRLAAIAIPWFVLTTTGSALRTGVVAMAQMGPYVVSQALAGPIIDRVGARRIAILSDAVAGLAMLAVPLLFALDRLSFPLLLVLLAVYGAADGPANAAKGVLVPEVTEQARVPLERTTGLVGTVERTASTVGPAVGGFLVAAWGGPAVLWVTAGFSLIGALITTTTIPAPRQPIERDPTGYFQQLRAGARYIKDERLLRSIYGMILVTNLIDTATFAVLLPVWAEQTGYGPAVIGILASALSGASIASSLTAAAIGHRLPRRMTYLIGFMIGGAPRIAILAFDVPLAVVIGVYAIGGLGTGFLNPIIGAIQFERIPRAMLGRVRTMGTALAWSGIPFGGVLAGVAVTGVGLAPSLLAAAAIYFVATTLPALRPEWAEMDDPAKRTSVHGDGHAGEPPGEDAEEDAGEQAGGERVTEVEVGDQPDGGDHEDQSGG
jgi:MFS family permease